MARLEDEAAEKARKAEENAKQVAEEAARRAADEEMRERLIAERVEQEKEEKKAEATKKREAAKRRKAKEVESGKSQATEPSEMGEGMEVDSEWQQTERVCDRCAKDERECEWRVKAKRSAACRVCTERKVKCAVGGVAVSEVGKTDRKVSGSEKCKVSDSGLVPERPFKTKMVGKALTGRTLQELDFEGASTKETTKSEGLRAKMVTAQEAGNSIQRNILEALRTMDGLMRVMMDEVRGLRAELHRYEEPAAEGLVMDVDPKLDMGMGSAEDSEDERRRKRKGKGKAKANKKK